MFELKKYKFLLLILLAIVSTYAIAFDYELEFKGFKTPLLKRIGCNCANQNEFDSFLGSYQANIARTLQLEMGVDAGILKTNTWAAKGFMNTYNNLLLSNYIGVEAKAPNDGFVIFVDWPEFGESR